MDGIGISGNVSLDMSVLNPVGVPIAGVSKYDELKDKPKINGVEVSGSKSLDDYGIASKADVESKLTGKVLKGKAKDTIVHVDDAFPSTILGIEIEGACKQDGTPSPDNPVPIEVIEHPVVKVTDADTSAVRTSIPFTMPAEHPYLAKLPDGTADEIVVDKDGNAELVARVYKAEGAKFQLVGRASELDSTNGVSIYGYLFNSDFTVRLTTVPKASGAAYCDKLYSAKVGTEKVTNAVYKPKSDVFVINIAGAKDNKDAKVKFEALKPTVYVPMKETRYTLGKIEMPKVQDSIVNVWTDAEVTPNTGIEYVRDVNIVVSNLESAIASITQG